MRSKRIVHSIVLLAAVVSLVGCPQPAVTYRSVTPVDMLDDSFYAGEAEDWSNIFGRQAYFARASHDGKRIAFYAWNWAIPGCAFFVVDVGAPDSYRRITFDYSYAPNAPIYWTPDDSALLVSAFRVEIPSEGAYSELVPLVIHGIPVNDASITSLPTDNWAISLVPYDTGDEIVALPILNDGTEDPARQPVFLTDFDDFAINADWPCVSPDGTRIAFANYEGTPEWIDGPDVSNVYVLENVQAILAAPPRPGTNISSLAPTGPDNANVVAIRTSESANFAHTPAFSQDSNLVFFTEDFNNLYQHMRFFDVLPWVDFDVMISNADGSGRDFRLKQPGNQAFATTTPGGVRILYGSEVGGSMHLFMSSIEAVTPVTGTALANNDVQTTARVKAKDGSGTVVSIPPGTTVDFPEGVEHAIEVRTPVDPVQPAELPSGIEAIPVTRRFGPDGTRFSPAVTVTIAYTDAEVRSFDEAGIRVFRYNADSGAYDEEATTGLVRDPDHNRISFPVDRFATYGLGLTTSK